MSICPFSRRPGIRAQSVSPRENPETAPATAHHSLRKLPLDHTAVQGARGAQAKGRPCPVKHNRDRVEEKGSFVTPTQFTSPLPEAHPPRPRFSGGLESPLSRCIGQRRRGRTNISQVTLVNPRVLDRHWNFRRARRRAVGNGRRKSPALRTGGVRGKTTFGHGELCFAPPSTRAARYVALQQRYEYTTRPSRATPHYPRLPRHVRIPRVSPWTATAAPRRSASPPARTPS